ncbi:pilus assembly protein TadG-related protein [Sulfitobacter aestuarii]|uniref:Pilus assembly protein TadG-related protein n=1 Tax=Sulfitobacter aestuarii TaxID=2161676 RepID=A0ABW5U039_9RHOB
MKIDPHPVREKDRNAGLCTRRFFREEDGMVTIFVCYMILIMLMIGGIGVDVMRNEMERTRIQSVSDRAVLAAADLDQPLDPKTVVEDYFAKSGMSDYLASVVVDEGLNYRTVEVDAKSTMKTQFMKMMGVDTLIVPARAKAEEKVNKVEISMVLDISGSMRENNKMENLHVAAGKFIDTVLRPETRDLISINVVPYTAQVNVGRAIFDELNIDRTHYFAHCVDFEQSDFHVAGLEQAKKYTHMQYFEAGYNWNKKKTENSINNPGCPKRSFEEVAAFSQSNTDLKSRINQFRPRANTAIHLGMKWGVAMLDPSFRTITQKLPVDTAFAARPADYTDIETMKTVILMTDGKNVNTVRIRNEKYANSSHRRDWSIYPLYYWLEKNVKKQRKYGDWAYIKYSSGQADTMLQNICNAAKAKKIIIWSIGFEVSNDSAQVMRDCASSPSHFFRVEGVEISEAFEAIARQINQLRLVL